jgi:hypothetical protein
LCCVCFKRGGELSLNCFYLGRTHNTPCALTKLDTPPPATSHRQVGIAFKESLVPRAVEWFTGEAAPPLYGDDEYEGEGGYEDDDE